MELRELVVVLDYSLQSFCTNVLYMQYSYTSGLPLSNYLPLSDCLEFHCDLQLAQVLLSISCVSAGFTPLFSPNQYKAGCEALHSLKVA